MADLRVYTEAFFDSKRVLAAVSRAQRKAGSKAGAFVRTRARSLIGNKVSRKTPPRPAGQAPRNRKGQLRRFILFAWDFNRQSTFVGPAILPRSMGNGIVLTSGTVPEALEFGGRGRKAKRKYFGRHALTTTGRQYGYAKHGLNLAVDRKMSRGEVGEMIGAALRGETPAKPGDGVTITPHPFMNPALEREAKEGTIASAWSNSITP